MALVYLYSLYEGIIRIFFRKVAYHDLKIPEHEFNEQYRKFQKIINLMKSQYGIYLDDDVFGVIMKLKKARHNIAHGVGVAKPEFEIIVLCHQVILEYFDFIEEQMFRKLKLI